ncbi:unnamed protein product [Closterium sp. Yama58-4]|nr:unnamed protein product [Closterium sp. Yama58-4]
MYAPVLKALSQLLHPSQYYTPLVRRSARRYGQIVTQSKGRQLCLRATRVVHRAPAACAGESADAESDGSYRLAGPEIPECVQTRAEHDDSRVPSSAEVEAFEVEARNRITIGLSTDRDPPPVESVSEAPQKQIPSSLESEARNRITIGLSTDRDQVESVSEANQRQSPPSVEFEARNRITIGLSTDRESFEGPSGDDGRVSSTPATRPAAEPPLVGDDPSERDFVTGDSPGGCNEMTTDSNQGASARSANAKPKKPRQAKKVKPPLVRDNEPLDVLYEDDWILVVNKPAGVKHSPLHRFVGGALVNRVAHYLQADPFTVHRLDMFTSGVICFAKTRAISQALHQAFRSKDQVAKQYLVLVVGLPPSDSFVIDAPIARDPDHEFARMVVGEEVGERRGEGNAEEQREGMEEDEAEELGAMREGTGEETGGRGEGVGESVGESGMKKEGKTQAAVTEFRVLARSKASGVSLLQAVPVTGRTHQIRVHLQHAKLPVLADHIYGALPLMWGEHCREWYSQLEETHSDQPNGDSSLNCQLPNAPIDLTGDRDADGEFEAAVGGDVFLDAQEEFPASNPEVGVEGNVTEGGFPRGGIPRGVFINLADDDEDPHRALFEENWEENASRSPTSEDNATCRILFVESARGNVNGPKSEASPHGSAHGVGSSAAPAGNAEGQEPQVAPQGNAEGQASQAAPQRNADGPASATHESVRKQADVASRIRRAKVPYDYLAAKTRKDYILYWLHYKWWVIMFMSTLPKTEVPAAERLDPLNPDEVGSHLGNDKKAEWSTVDLDEVYLHGPRVTGWRIQRFLRYMAEETPAQAEMMRRGEEVVAGKEPIPSTPSMMKAKMSALGFLGRLEARLYDYPKAQADEYISESREYMKLKLKQLHDKQVA